ncbi:hypothetical protein [uncultured Jatrophihabitans sp.]|uniref:hypothetical protein n=1 Tax=uncultured Jatrophihabitans sp. TaxID=1610747 RepID=UPI0035CBE3AA
MWTIDPNVAESLRHPRRITSHALFTNLVTGAATPLPILDGTVTEDVTTATRRVLDLTTLPRIPVAGQIVDVFTLLDTPGGEITVTQTIWYGTTGVVVPQGVFIVDSDNVDYSDAGTVTITAPDRRNKVIRNKFGNARSSVATNAAWQEIKRLVEGAWPGTTYPFPGWSQLDTSATAKVGTLLWDDGDRDGAVQAIEKANSVEQYFDRQGFAVLRPTPVLTPSSTPVWTVDANTPTAIMTAASRSRDMSTVVNAVRVSTSASDVIFTPVEVKNTTPGDPLNVTGPLGTVFTDYDSPLLRSSAQATAAGRTQLSKQLGEAKQLTLAAMSNPALDAEDVIQVMLPRLDRTTSRPVELHIIDSITHPLVPGTDQQITTRSTRPATDGT